MKVKNYTSLIISALMMSFLLHLSAFSLLSAQDWKQGKDVNPWYKGWEGNPDSLKVLIGPGFDTAQQARIREAMKRWNDAGCVPKFKEVTSRPAHVTIDKSETTAKNEGTCKYNYNPVSDKRDSCNIKVKTSPTTAGLSFKELVTHELGHALGLADTDPDKNPGDVMKSRGANGTGGNLSKHDSTEIKAAKEIAMKTETTVVKASEPETALNPGQTGMLTFILPQLAPPGSVIDITTMNNDQLFVNSSYIIDNLLFVNVFSHPEHGSGSIYLDVVIVPPATPLFEFIGTHYISTTPLPLITFQCPFTVSQQDGKVLIEWQDLHSYPFPGQDLSSTLFVNNTQYTVRNSYDYEIELEPGIYEFTLIVDDYQVNQASYSVNYEVTGNATTIFAGSDLYTVPMANVSFGEGSEYPSLPAGFFGNGSLPFTGEILFRGLASQGTQSPYADLRINRTSSLTFDEVLPSTGEVPVDIFFLSLKSWQPIVVSYEGMPDSFFDVFVNIMAPHDRNNRTDGFAMITQTGDAGGYFTMNLSIQPVFRFVNLYDPTVMFIWDPAMNEIDPLQFTSILEYNWTLSPIEGEFDPLGDTTLDMTTAMGTSIELLPLLIRENNSFFVEVDETGEAVSWGGDGYNYGEWFYYDFTDWWNVWFYDHPVDTLRKKYLTGGNMILSPRALSMGNTYIEIVFNYTTPQWPGWQEIPRPPLPSDFQSIEEENAMIQRSETIFTYNGLLSEQINIELPSPFPPLVSDYNPEWLSIDIRGYNFDLSGSITHVCFNAWGSNGLFEFGDAPDSAPAYLGANATIGLFPTCASIPTTGFIRHSTQLAWFGLSYDLESDGNAGMCPLFSANYNLDECFDDGDAGLIVPGTFSIVGDPGQETIVPCPNSSGDQLGITCDTAFWGQDIDMLVVNQMATPAYVNVLIDWNQDGVWGGYSECDLDGTVRSVSEHVLVNKSVPSGYSDVLSALVGDTLWIGPNAGYVWARFSITDCPVAVGWDGSGIFLEGETEDYLFLIGEPDTDLMDFGDAPDPDYPTFASSDGARHIVDGFTFLGFGVDGEPDGLPTANADGDDINGIDDEDGITFEWPMVPGQPCKMKVVANMNDALFNGWIDYDGNGSWADPGEQIFTDVNLPSGSLINPGLFTRYLTFIVPQNAANGTTFSRFRFSHQVGLSFTGLAYDGEVEDYLHDITSETGLKWIQYHGTELPGLHAHDNMAAGEYQQIIVADDWICNGGAITTISWFGNYESRGSGINYFNLSIYDHDPVLCKPGDMNLWSASVSISSAQEIFTGQFNSEGDSIFLYSIALQEPFNQVEGTRYWLSITAVSNQIHNPALWRWQEAARSYIPILCPASELNIINGIPSQWAHVSWPVGQYFDYSDMAFALSVIPTGSDTTYYSVSEVYTSPDIQSGDTIHVIGYYIDDVNNALLQHFGSRLKREAWPPHYFVKLTGQAVPDDAWNGGYLNVKGVVSYQTNPSPYHPEDSLTALINILNIEILKNGKGKSSGRKLPDEGYLPVRAVDNGCDSCKFALFISGGISESDDENINQNFPAFWDDLVALYNHKIENEGYCVDNIFVHYFEGTGPDNSIGTVTESTTARIQNSALEIAKRVSACTKQGKPAQFQKFVSNHGDPGGDVCLVGNEVITGSELAQIQQQIIDSCCSEVKDEFTQCYGGQTIDSILAKIDNKNKATIYLNSAADDNVSWGPYDTTHAYLAAKIEALSDGLDYQDAVVAAKLGYDADLEAGIEQNNQEIERLQLLRIRALMRNRFALAQRIKDEIEALEDDNEEMQAAICRSVNVTVIPMKEYCEWKKFVVPPGGQLILDFKGSNQKCGNVSVYKGTKDNKVGEWNWNIPGSAGYQDGYNRRVINGDSTESTTFWIHNDNGAFSLTASSTGNQADSITEFNPVEYAGCSFGGTDNSSTEFGVIHQNQYFYELIDQIPMSTLDIPGTIGNGFVEDFGFTFEINTEDEYWTEMELYIRVNEVIEPGILQILSENIPDYMRTVMIGAPGVYTVPLGDMTISGPYGMMNFIVSEDRSGLVFSFDCWGLRTAYVPPVQEYDFGDAPDGPYPTLLASNGAQHSPDGFTYLGNLIDVEPDGIPGIYALGDNWSASDDEDGVNFLNAFVRDEVTTIEFTVTGIGYINAWFDWNINGTWSDPGEHAIINYYVGTGVVTYDVTVPDNAVAGMTYARFRFSSMSDINYYGLVADGEVEDYRILINDPVGHKMHYPQYPKPDGFDIEFWSILGDDFRCSQTGPLEYIRFWISHKQNIITETGIFTISVHSDIPANQNPDQFSMPGEALWSQTFYPGDYTEMPMTDNWQHWIELPLGTAYGYYDHNKWTQITIDDIPEPFIQTEDSIYWLVINFGDFSAFKGWKESAGTQFNDAAVYWSFGEWQPLYAPDQHLIDFAFIVNDNIEDHVTLQDITVTPGSIECYNANETIVTGGDGTYFIVQNNAVVYLITGQSISMLPHTHFESGSYVHAYIDLSGDYCQNPKSIVTHDEIPEDNSAEFSTGNQMFRIYPNPTPGLFTLEFEDATDTSTIKVEIFNMLGEKMMSVELPMMKQYLFDLSAKQTGLYLIKVMKGDDAGIIKIVKQ